jgi:drug/metabolite transporter (DMT)-like permease
MKSIRGYLLILGAATFWGISATVARYLITREFDTLLLVQMRITLSCVLLLPFFLLYRPELLRVKRGDLFDFALLGIVGAAGSNFTYYFAIQETNVATAILMQYLAPVLVLLYAAITKEERVTFIKVAAGAASLAGCFLAIAGKDLSIIRISGWGLASGLGSAFCWAFTNVWLRRLLKNYHVWTCILYSFIFASVFWLFINPPWVIFDGHVSADTWAVLLLIAVISVLIPHSLYFSGIRYLTASRAIITATFEPVIAIITAAIFVGEVPGTVQAIGAVLVLSAIAILQIKHEDDQLITAPADHPESRQPPVHAP